MDENEINKKKVLLYDYLTYNFTPALGSGLKRNWLKWFVMYWRNEIIFDELARVSPVSTYELRRRFDVFFKSEDLE